MRKYADFLKSEEKWREFLSQRDVSNKVNPTITSLEDNLVTLEPFSETPLKEETSNNLFQEFTSPLDFNYEAPIEDDNLVNFADIKAPQIEEPVRFDTTFNNSAFNDEFKTSTYEGLDDIQAQLDKLDELKSSLNDSQDISFDDSYNNGTLGFNDISPELFDTNSYGRGGRAA